MSSYWLSPHVYVCRTQDHIVMLDLEGDKYLALTIDQERSIAPFVYGWPIASTSPQPPADANEPPLLHQLLARRLLTHDSENGKTAEPSAVSIAGNTLLLTSLLHTLDANSPRPPRVTPVDMLYFLLAFIKVEITLRRKKLPAAIARICRRNTLASAKDVDYNRLRLLITKFRLIRPFIYSARENCLKDAFVLVEFLARYGFYPNWIFGVRTRPFIAHCWVQSNDYVLNDTPDHIGTFTPIMCA